MKHGPWTLDPAPKGFVRWRCSSCNAVIDFHADPKEGTPSSGVDRPPDDVDSYLDACPNDDAAKLAKTLVAGIEKSSDEAWKTEARAVLVVAGKADLVDPTTAAEVDAVVEDLTR